MCIIVLPSEGPLKAKLEEAGASTLVINYGWWCGSVLPSQEEISIIMNDSLIKLYDSLDALSLLNPDVIVTNTMVIPWGALTAYFVDKPHIWFVREFGELDHNLKFFLPFTTVIDLIKSSSNQILVNSHAVCQTLFKEGRQDKVQVIYPPVNIISDNNSNELKKYYARAESLKLIILGTICEGKGQKDAVQAVCELLKNNQDVELIVMGAADQIYLEELKEIVRLSALENSIHFLDFVPDPYIILNQADIALVCSRNEAFGRIIIEAFMFKKPVIAANSGGVPEIVMNDFNGLLYEAGDYHQLSGKIGYFIWNKDMIKELGENGYNFALNHFNKEKSGEEFFQVLSNLKNSSNQASELFAEIALKTKQDLIIYLINTIRYRDEKITTFEECVNPGALKAFVKLFPQNSKRRVIIKLIISGGVIIVNEGWKCFFRRFKNWLKSLPAYKEIKRDRI